MLYIHNTLTGQRERFVPIKAGKVGMYVCGITPYGDWHIGNARSAVVFDAVRRHLMASGYEVTFVRNITDIDDKIIDVQKKTGDDCAAIAEKYRDAMHADLEALNVLAPNQEPHATAYIDKIIAMISTLVEKDYAYATEAGDVYFKVRHFKKYGQLSGQSIEEMQSGARIEVDGDKQDPLDFALWKAKKPSEPSWSSPWGDGRPGWHIECSAMSTDLLGPHFDIHAGGLDLKFPHHENEIAQSCAATDDQFANYWLHNGMLELGGTKMSKSLGNIDCTRDVLAKFHPEVVRFYLLSANYRNPLNYSDDDLANAKAGLTRLYTALRGLEPMSSETDHSITDYANYQERFMAAMDDDFNTPEA
ncbi:MAG: cysteine--tRNA ligase, partial [Gammaproteobacteria bacterium]|nr:cysteine--tRNA ligase [Gammaproteobacteria bacterium]